MGLKPIFVAHRLLLLCDSGLNLKIHAIMTSGHLLDQYLEHPRLSDPVKFFQPVGMKFMEKISMGIKILLFKTRKTQ